jgi:hypothetical protein
LKLECPRGAIAAAEEPPATGYHHWQAAHRSHIYMIEDKLKILSSFQENYDDNFVDEEEVEESDDEVKSIEELEEEEEDIEE